MAYYENKVEHFGGALVLFQRNLAVAVPSSQTHRAATWYMRLKIAGHAGYVTKSTKLTLYEDAYEFAKSELLRLQQAKRRALNQIFPDAAQPGRLRSKLRWSFEGTEVRAIKSVCFMRKCKSRLDIP